MILHILFIIFDVYELAIDKKCKSVMIDAYKYAHLFRISIESELNYLLSENKG